MKTAESLFNCFLSVIQYGPLEMTQFEIDHSKCGERLNFNASNATALTRYCSSIRFTLYMNMKQVTVSLQADLAAEGFRLKGRAKLSESVLETTQPSPSSTGKSSAPCLCDKTAR